MSACLALVGLLVTCLGGNVPPAVAEAPAVAVAPTRPAVAQDEWIAEDKLRHFTVSAAATTVGFGVARAALDGDEARVAAALTAAVLGVGKEVVDRRRGGPFSLKDLVWDAAGIAAGLALVHRIR